MQRVQKIIAHAGITSRRKAEALIEGGKVKVNNKIITLGDKADPSKDRILVDGKLLKVPRKEYYIVNKPKGYISSKVGPKNILELVPNKDLFHVGRLDRNSQGLMILTNDGDLANDIIHPSKNVTKEYVVMLDKILAKKDKAKIKKGVLIERRRVNVQSVEVDETFVTLTIHEGRKHILRKLFDKLGYKVRSLTRTKIGNLELNLGIGKAKKVSRHFLQSNIFTTKPKDI